MEQRHVYDTAVVKRQFQQALEYAKAQIDRGCRGSFADRPTWKREIQLERSVEGVFEVWWDVMHLVGSTYFRQLHLVRTRDEVDVRGRRTRLDFIVDLLEFSRTGRPEGFPRIGVAIGRHWPTDDEVALAAAQPQFPEDGGLPPDAGWQVFHFTAAEVMSRPADCIDVVSTFGELAVMHYCGV